MLTNCYWSKGASCRPKTDKIRGINKCIFKISQTSPFQNTSENILALYMVGLSIQKQQSLKMLSHDQIKKFASVKLISWENFYHGEL